MHLVFVTSLVPDGAPSTGYEIANAAIIAALRRRGVQVTVLGYVRPGRKPVDPQDTIVLGELDPATDKASPALKLRWLATSMSTGLTVSSAKLRVLSDDDFRRALASAGPADGYVLNAVQMSAAYEAALRDRPAIYVAHNVEHLSARESARTAPGAVRRLLFAREARLLEAIENRLCRNARFVFTLAEDDRHALAVSAPDRSAVLPLVTRSRAVAPAGKRTIRRDAGLIGTWTWQPNRIGLEWFLEKVTPHLAAGFSVAVAGSTPRDLPARFPNVRFLGRVEDADEFVRSSAMIPLVSRAGTGVQLKTIETFELGIPAVATASALRGIAMVPENCIGADEPKAFARAMMDLACRDDRDVDGSVFFRAQMHGLDAAVATGLEALAPGRQAVPA